jgi:hypothetical protein
VEEIKEAEKEDEEEGEGWRGKIIEKEQSLSDKISQITNIKLKPLYTSSSSSLSLSTTVKHSTDLARFLHCICDSVKIR